VNETTKPNVKVEAAAEPAGDADDDVIANDDELGAEGPASIDELDDLELDGEIGDDLEDDEVAIDDEDEDSEGDLALDDVELEAVGPVAKVVPKEPADGAAEADTDDDELLADEVEASLDVILAERLRGDDTESDEVEVDDEEDEGLPNQLATVIPVRQPDEFLCQSCFLLKPPGQLADPAHQLCRDCA
jgi:hypothetical protein